MSEHKVAENTDEMDIVQYCTHLYHTLGWEGMRKEFIMQRFHFKTPSLVKGTPQEQNFLMINYKEHCRLWKAKWARQCRGIILYRDGSQFWILKQQLQRGAEVLTDMHIKCGIHETQDVKLRSIQQFDATQQETITKLSRGECVDGYLSFKMDGSLQGISCYRGKAKRIMGDLIMEYGDEFSKTTLALASELKLDYLPVLNTRTTLCINGEMQDYAVTAMLSSLNIASYSELCEHAKHKSAVQVWERYGRAFLGRFHQLYTSFYKSHPSEIITFMFESICKKRTTSWGRTHNELAISYPQSEFRCLGATFGQTDVQYLPHFVFSQDIRDATFEEPVWWKIDQTTQINQMMAGLSECIRKQIRSEEFYRRFPPNNQLFVSERNSFLDYEGFIFYRNQDCRYDYSKIKTEEYYKCHKVKAANVEYLIDLSKYASDIFPSTLAVVAFCEGLEDKLVRIGTELVELLKDESKELFRSLPSNAQAKFETYAHETRAKILINASGGWNERCLDRFIREFPLLRHSLTEREEVYKGIKAVVMCMALWGEGVRSAVQGLLNEKHPSINCLFEYMSNSNPDFSDE